MNEDVFRELIDHLSMRVILSNSKPPAGRTDVYSEIETAADHSAARDASSATRIQNYASFRCQLTPRNLTRISTGQHFSTFLAPGVPPFATMDAYPASFPITTVALPSFLMPDSFNGSGDFKYYLLQLNASALLLGWHT